MTDRPSSDETRDIEWGLGKLAAAGTRTPTGGVGSSKFRTEFALLAVGLAGQGRLAATVEALVASGVLPPAAQGFDAKTLSEWVVGHPEVAAGLVANLPGNAVPGSPEAFLASVGDHVDRALAAPTLAKTNASVCVDSPRP